MSKVEILTYFIGTSSLFYMLKIPFPNINIFEVIFLIYIIKILHYSIYKLLELSLISLEQVENRQKIYFCKTFHARFWPVKHSFKYPLILVGVDLDLLEQQQQQKKDEWKL